MPYVVDLQDPWLSDYYSRPGSGEPPGGRAKYGLSQRLAKLLEPATMRSTSHVISVSPGYPATLMHRYPWLDESCFTVLPFGAPERDFEILERETITQSVFDPDDGNTHWVYVGRAGGDMRLSLSGFFQALEAARRSRPEAFRDLIVHFVGTDYAQGDRARRTVEPVAREFGVDDLVDERPHRVPYFEALQCLRDADRLLVIGSDDPSYTASKLYPYVLARKPMLAVFHEESSVVGVIRGTRAGDLITFGDGESPDHLARRIEPLLLPGGVSSGETDWIAFAPYCARTMTARQVAVFDRVIDSAA